METLMPRKSHLSLFTQLPSFYPQTVENSVFITVPRILKKIGRFMPGLHISEDRQCSHGPQLGHHGLVSKP